MTDEPIDAAPAAVAEPDVELFDDEDVEDDGDQAPDGDELTDAEIAAIRASQDDPATSPADAEAN